MNMEYDVVSRDSGFMYRVSLEEKEAVARQKWSDVSRNGLYKYFPVCRGEYDRDAILKILYSDTGVPNV